MSSDAEIETVAADHEMAALLDAVTNCTDPDETMIRIFGTPRIARFGFDEKVRSLTSKALSAPGI